MAYRVDVAIPDFWTDIHLDANSAVDISLDITEHLLPLVDEESIEQTQQYVERSLVEAKDQGIIRLSEMFLPAESQPISAYAIVQIMPALAVSDSADELGAIFETLTNMLTHSVTQSDTSIVRLDDGTKAVRLYGIQNIVINNQGDMNPAFVMHTFLPHEDTIIHLLCLTFNTDLMDDFGEAFEAISNTLHVRGTER
ncbi:hypothetical protein ACFQY8_07490 [Alloscardovia venturai]|uniref:Uncharacterized protein n=1 Tax=Alloscardovia venturai TaxID=1769421 RepID=A0ABW2Y9T2_9BIFI